jgi:hypothetical protein
VMEDMVAPSSPTDAWSRYWKSGARHSPGTISITLTGATPPRRSLRFWRNYGSTLTYKQGECPTLRIRTPAEPVAKPSWNGRYLRIAAVHRAVFERPRTQARD